MSVSLPLSLSLPLLKKKIIGREVGVDEGGQRSTKARQTLKRWLFLSAMESPCRECHCLNYAFRRLCWALAGVGPWIERWPVNQKVADSIPVGAQAWVAVQIPSWLRERSNQMMFLSLPFSLPPALWWGGVGWGGRGKTLVCTEWTAERARGQK